MGVGAADDLTHMPDWDRRSRQFVDHAPSILLAIGVVLALLQPASAQHRLVTVGLSLVAAGWQVVLLRVPVVRGGHPAPAFAYLVGYLVLATTLTLHDPAFFTYMIGAFFVAFALVLPWPLIVLGVGATSVLLYTLSWGGVPDPSTPDFGLYVAVIVVQTLATSGGVVVGRKSTELMDERRRTVAELQAALDENAELHAQLLAQAREGGVRDERQRLAREIHDTLAQGLTGIVTQLEAAVRSRDDRGRRHIDTALSLARNSLTDARRSVLALAPEALADARLPDALADVGRRWSAHHGVTVDVATTGRAEPLHPTVEVTLLRVAQEALANVARHAAASRAVVTLSYMDDLVTLDVRDDGVGFVPDVAAAGNGAGGEDGGFGLTAMRQRLSGVDGTLAVESEPGAGTSISAAVPAVPLAASRPWQDPADG